MTTPLIERIDRLRKQAGLSRSELCDNILQVRRVTYYRWLNGTNYPSDTKPLMSGILKLEKALSKKKLPFEASLHPPKFPSKIITEKRAEILRTL